MREGRSRKQEQTAGGRREISDVSFKIRDIKAQSLNLPPAPAVCLLFF
jgi:hypothetical protein